MTSVLSLQLIRDKINLTKKMESEDPSLKQIPRSSLTIYKKVRDDLRTIYLVKCMDEYYIHYEECEHVRRLLFDKTFD